MNKEIEKLREELAYLKKTRDHFVERNKLRQEILSLKKGFNVWSGFNPFRDVEVKENLKEIWYPIRSYIIGMKRQQRREERRLYKFNKKHGNLDLLGVPRMPMIYVR